MNKVIETILNRKSIRKFKNGVLKDEEFDLIIKCGIQAPSAINHQPWYFCVIKNRSILDEIVNENKKILKEFGNEKEKEMAKNEDYDNFRGAPCAIIVFGEKDWKFSVGDCANATMNMALAAESLNIGSCYLASFKISYDKGSNKINEICHIDERYFPCFALALGYKDEKPVSKPRNNDCVNYL